jgi:DtxR family Mn-dependent transcriptional regulator
VPTETVENYLKAAHRLCAESPTGEAGLVRLAAAVGVTKGTAASMVRKLVEAKLVKAERYGGITLTAKGRTAALDVMRRHRLIEAFLVETLKFDWSEVHDEAERLEHAVSRRFVDRLDEFLGHPSTDPHGDPIPDAGGKVREGGSVPLTECSAEARVRIARVAHQSPEFLRFAAEHRLTPGRNVRVVQVSRQGESMTVEPEGHPAVVLSLAAAGRLLVEVA